MIETLDSDGQKMNPESPNSGMPVSAQVFGRIIDGYALPLMGTHGLPHWGRVLENGRRVGQAAGADLLVVELFALFHDARRVNEGWDPGHGMRGAHLAVELRSSLPTLTDAQFGLLCEACEGHTDGSTHADPTIGACWDADRLDLWRVGTTPVANLLCTDAARDRDVLAWARQRSVGGMVPGFVTEGWLKEVGRAP